MLKKAVLLDEKARFHARPAARIAEAAGKYESVIWLEGTGVFADCKKLLALMKVKVPASGLIEIHADGPDEEEAVSDLEKLLTEMSWL